MPSYVRAGIRKCARIRALSLPPPLPFSVVPKASLSARRNDKCAHLWTQTGPCMHARRRAAESDGGEGLLQVGDKVVGAFDADGQAHQVRGHLQRGAGH